MAEHLKRSIFRKAHTHFRWWYLMKILIKVPENVTFPALYIRHGENIFRRLWSDLLPGIHIWNICYFHWNMPTVFGRRAYTVLSFFFWYILDISITMSLIYDKQSYFWHRRVFMNLFYICSLFKQTKYKCPKCNWYFRVILQIQTFK